MNKVNLFINTNVTDTGIVNYLADFALSPVRYFFGGRKVQVIRTDGQPHVHSVRSYSKDLNCTKSSRTNRDLESDSSYLLNDVFMPVGLLPGLIAGVVLKSFALLTGKVQEKYDLAARHFVRVDKTIGSPEALLQSEMDIIQALRVLGEEREREPLHQKVNNLVIYAKKGVEIVKANEIFWINPQKLIVVGAKLIDGPCGGFYSSLDEVLARTEKWLGSSVAVHTLKQSTRSAQDHLPVEGLGDEMDLDPLVELVTEVDMGSFVAQFQSPSVAAAKQHVLPKISRFSTKRFRAVYNVPASVGEI